VNKSFKFVDLFCGIGGFHQALKSFGGECVFAADIDDNCDSLYKINYGQNCKNDITQVNERDIPEHQVLCAGFPCQAFSKAGKRAGINDARGTLFFDICRILQHHKTKYIILENVRNLFSHDDGNTWKIIQTLLQDLGYRLTAKPLILSPHQFGIPQFRERVYILGIYDPQNVNLPLDINLPLLLSKERNDIFDIIKEPVDKKYYINEYEEKVLHTWDEFYQGINLKVIGFPVWYDYFKEEACDSLPTWKKEFVIKNNSLYQENKEFIDKWEKKHNYLKDFKPTHRKFEWQAGKKIKSIWEGVIQFRPSGIRVKTPDLFPALVAIVQIPIIGKYKRRLTPRECARLQSFPEDFVCDINDLQAYKQFGNSVNVDIIKTLFNELRKF